MRVSNTELQKMLTEQLALNKKFNENWRDEVTLNEIYTAIFTEVAEFLESSPEQWKWWKRAYLKNDKQNQYIEIVDVIHFGLSYVLYNFDIPKILRQNEETIRYEGCVFDMLELFRHHPTIDVLFSLVKSMAEYANLDCDELVRIYFEKLAINHQRVDNGYTTGDYEKVDENGDEDNRSIKIKED